MSQLVRKRSTHIFLGLAVIVALVVVGNGTIRNAHALNFRDKCESNTVGEHTHGSITIDCLSFVWDDGTDFFGVGWGESSEVLDELRIINTGWEICSQSFPIQAWGVDISEDDVDFISVGDSDRMATECDEAPDPTLTSQSSHKWTGIHWHDTVHHKDHPFG